LLVEKFPAQILEVYGELLFFQLLVRAVNDEDTDCRRDILGVMRAIVFCKKIPHSKIKAWLNTILKMGSDDQEKAE